MRIHGSRSLAILLQVHEVDIAWPFKKYKVVSLQRNLPPYNYTTVTMKYKCIPVSELLLIPVYACHMISVYDNLYHNLTAKLKRIPRPVSHAS